MSLVDTFTATSVDVIVVDASIVVVFVTLSFTSSTNTEHSFVVRSKMTSFVSVPSLTVVTCSYQPT